MNAADWITTARIRFAAIEIDGQAAFDARRRAGDAVMRADLRLNEARAALEAYPPYQQASGAGDEAATIGARWAAGLEKAVETAQLERAAAVEHRAAVERKTDGACRLYGECRAVMEKLGEAA